MSDLADLFTTARDVVTNGIEPINLGDGVTQRVVPAGFTTHITDIEPYLDSPRRARGGVTVDRTESFLAYVNRFASTAAIAYVQPDGPRVVAHLNDHMPVDGDAEVPGWADWTATLAWRTTTAWQHWIKLDRQMLTQEQFAEHIEEGMRSIVEPDAATLLEIAQTFKAEMTAQIAQARRLPSGEVRFTWNESIDASAGRDGDLSIPSTITLALAPFEGAERILVEARLRYRIGTGANRQLQIGYLLDNPQQILRDAVEREVVTLRDQLDESVTVIYGQRS